MSAPTVPAVSPVRVVLVDDSDDVRFLVRMRLDREEDFVVVGEAADGARGVHVVAEHHPHVVLLDVAMPVMDGLEALPLIREESPGSIVVMLSALDEESEVALTCRALGAAGFVQKGVPISVLVTELRELLVREFGRTPEPGSPGDLEPGTGDEPGPAASPEQAPPSE